MYNACLLPGTLGREGSGEAFSILLRMSYIIIAAVFPPFVRISSVVCPGGIVYTQLEFLGLATFRVLIL